MQEKIAGLCLILIGILLILFPKVVFDLTEKWKYANKRAEISDMYKLILRLVGIVLCVVGLVVFF